MASEATSKESHRGVTDASASLYRVSPTAILQPIIIAMRFSDRLRGSLRKAKSHLELRVDHGVDNVARGFQAFGHLANSIGRGGGRGILRVTEGIDPAVSGFIANSGSSQITVQQSRDVGTEEAAAASYALDFERLDEVVPSNQMTDEERMSSYDRQETTVAESSGRSEPPPYYSNGLDNHHSSPAVPSNHILVSDIEKVDDRLHVSDSRNLQTSPLFLQSHAQPAQSSGPSGSSEKTQQDSESDGENGIRFAQNRSQDDDDTNLHRNTLPKNGQAVLENMSEQTQSNSENQVTTQSVHNHAHRVSIGTVYTENVVPNAELATFGEPGVFDCGSRSQMYLHQDPSTILYLNTRNAAKTQTMAADLSACETIISDEDTHTRNLESRGEQPLEVIRATSDTTDAELIERRRTRALFPSCNSRNHSPRFTLNSDVILEVDEDDLSNPVDRFGPLELPKPRGAFTPLTENNQNRVQIQYGRLGDQSARPVRYDCKSGAQRHLDFHSVLGVRPNGSISPSTSDNNGGSTLANCNSVNGSLSESSVSQAHTSAAGTGSSPQSLYQRDALKRPSTTHSLAASNGSGIYLHGFGANQNSLGHRRNSGQDLPAEITIPVAPLLTSPTGPAPVITSRASGGLILDQVTPFLVPGEGLKIGLDGARTQLSEIYDRCIETRLRPNTIRFEVTCGDGEFDGELSGIAAGNAAIATKSHSWSSGDWFTTRQEEPEETDNLPAQNEARLSTETIDLETNPDIINSSTADARFRSGRDNEPSNLPGPRTTDASNSEDDLRACTDQHKVGCTCSNQHSASSSAKLHSSEDHSGRASDDSLREEPSPGRFPDCPIHGYRGRARSESPGEHLTAKVDDNAEESDGTVCNYAAQIHGSLPRNGQANEHLHHSSHGSSAQIESSPAALSEQNLSLVNNNPRIVPHELSLCESSNPDENHISPITSESSSEFMTNLVNYAVAQTLAEISQSHPNGLNTMNNSLSGTVPPQNMPDNSISHAGENYSANLLGNSVEDLDNEAGDSNSESEFVGFFMSLDDISQHALDSVQKVPKACPSQPNLYTETVDKLLRFKGYTKPSPSVGCTRGVLSCVLEALFLHSRLRATWFWRWRPGRYSYPAEETSDASVQDFDMVRASTGFSDLSPPVVRVGGLASSVLEALFLRLRSETSWFSHWCLSKYSFRKEKKTDASVADLQMLHHFEHECQLSSSPILRIENVKYSDMTAQFLRVRQKRNWFSRCTVNNIRRIESSVTERGEVSINQENDQKEQLLLSRLRACVSQWNTSKNSTTDDKSGHDDAYSAEERGPLKRKGDLYKAPFSYSCLHGSRVSSIGLGGSLAAREEGTTDQGTSSSTAMASSKEVYDFSKLELCKPDGRHRVKTSRPDDSSFAELCDVEGRNSNFPIAMVEDVRSSIINACHLSLHATDDLERVHETSKMRVRIGVATRVSIEEHTVPEEVLSVEGEEMASMDSNDDGYFDRESWGE